MLKVANIQRYCVDDGPGVRTTVFLKGCTLACPWCCNPETIHPNEDEIFDKNICCYPQENVVCKNCEKHHGSNSILNCPISAYERTYSLLTNDELFKLLLQDKDAFSFGGGVTFSGGEPLVQFAELLPLLQILKKNEVHISFESSLFVPSKIFEASLDFVDYWMIDLKFQYGYVINPDFSVDSNDVYKNIQLLKQKKDPSCYSFRMVVMQEILKDHSEIMQRLKDCQISQIELLPFHDLGKPKYMYLKKKSSHYTTPTNEEMSFFCNFLKKSDIKAEFLSL